MKQCSKCKLLLPSTEFSFSKSTKDGLCSLCKSCMSNYCRENYQKTKVERKKKEDLKAAIVKATPKVPIEEKKCTKCKQTKAVTEFSKSCRRKDGYEYWCKLCRLESLTRSYQRKIEQIKKDTP